MPPRVRDEYVEDADQRAFDFAELHRFRAKAARWVEFRPPLTREEAREKQDCFGDCPPMLRAVEDFLFEQDICVEPTAEMAGYRVIRMRRVYSAGLGRHILLSLCPRCQTVHWSEIV